MVAGDLSVNGGAGCLPQNEVRSLCGLAGRRKDCFFIVLQDLDPALYIVGMGFNRRVDHAQLPDGEGGPQLSDKLFKGIRIIPEPFPEVAIQAGFVARPMGEFM